MYILPVYTFTSMHNFIISCDRSKLNKEGEKKNNQRRMHGIDGCVRSTCTRVTRAWKLLYFASNFNGFFWKMYLFFLLPIEWNYLIFVSPADVEPPELDSLLDAIEIGLGFRDDATELQLDWHCVDKRCSDDDDDCDWIDCVVDRFVDGEQFDGVTLCTLSVVSQLTIILWNETIKIEIICIVQFNLVNWCVKFRSFDSALVLFKEKEGKNWTYSMCVCVRVYL